MSSVLARYEVSGERRKPKPSGSTSSVPSPKIETPFFAWLFSRAKIRSCLRMRLAFSMPLPTAILTSCVTWWAFSSDRCIGMAGAPAGGWAVSGPGDERTASGCAACDLLILGKCALGSGARSSWGYCLPRIGGGTQSVKASDVAVKKSRELRFGEGAYAGGLHVAVLEQHQRGDAADAEFCRHLLVLVDVDLGDFQAAFVLAGHLVQDRGYRLAGAAPLGPVVHQHRGFGPQHFGLERVVCHALNRRTAHGSSKGIAGRLLLWGRAATFPRDILRP